MKTPTKRAARRLAASLAIVTALFATSSAWAGTTTYYQIAGTSDETSIISMDGLAFEEEITHTSKLAFPGITLDDIPVGASFVSAMWGDWANLPSTRDAAVPAIGFCEQRCDTDNDGHCDKIALQVCAYSGSDLIGVVIVLTNGEGGVYVARHGRFLKNGSTYTTPYFSLASNGTISWTNNPSSPDTSDDLHYILQGLRVHGMSPVDTAPRLAFRGATLEDVKDSSFMAGYQFGTWMTSATVSNAAAFVSTWYDSNDGNKLKKVVMQFRDSNGATAVIELTDGVGGVYAQQVLGISGINKASTNAFAINDETGAVTKENGTIQGADKYGIHDFVILCPPCVKKTSSKIWSSGDLSHPLALDDIKDGKFGSRFYGSWVTDKEKYRKPNAAKGTIESQAKDDSGSVTNMVVWFEIDEDRKRVKVMFENREDGIYATGIAAKYTDGNDKDGTFVETYEGKGYALCDLRVTVPTVHDWTLDADNTWSTLRDGDTLESDEVVRITVTDPDAVLTVDENVEVAGIEFVDGTGATLQVNSGYTVTAESISGIGNIWNNGTLVKTGDGEATLPFDNASTGVTIVNAGTLKVASVTGTGSSHTIRVASGATFDVNGKSYRSGKYYGVTATVHLEEGANLANTSAHAGKNYNVYEIGRLVLEGDAMVTATEDFGICGVNYNGAQLDLDTHTLTVIGGKELMLYGTTVTGTGKVVVESGKLTTYDTSGGNDWTLETRAGGTLIVNGTSLTVGNFVNGGSVSGGATLTVNGTFTPGSAAINKLTLANGATVKATGTAQAVSTTFTATGAYTIDASEITKEQLDAAEEQRIPVLTVPTAQVGGTWSVSNPPCRAKWVDNGGGTSTLYLTKPTGLMIIFR